ncbi:DUF4184 family protein [Leeia aquatica]|uniref:DUF4184 family protein n=1 Tax=Leeia aquatica TaxID=2725557 RepID=A0A847S9S6_9NEIS|nr:DUF4184 family protein [Leeia aquatica]NLR74316.1 DUF4184 family protein [Leeia aquatica]
MPWTFAHLAAVLPLQRLKLPLTGLALGSIAPDLGYYIGRFDWATQAHTVSGLVTHCLPVVLPLAWLLVLLLPLWSAPLPEPHRSAWRHAPRPCFWPGMDLLRMLLALLLGAATHIVWDAATHYHGLFVQTWPVLREPLLVLGGRTVAVYSVLQHGSTLFGVGVLTVAYRRWLRRVMPERATATDPHPLHGWGGLLLLVLLAFAGGALLSLRDAWPGISSESLLVRTTIHATSLFALTYAALAVGLWLRERR